MTLITVVKREIIAVNRQGAEKNNSTPCANGSISPCLQQRYLYKCTQSDPTSSKVLQLPKNTGDSPI